MHIALLDPTRVMFIPGGDMDPRQVMKTDGDLERMMSEARNLPPQHPQAPQAIESNTLQYQTYL